MHRERTRPQNSDNLACGARGSTGRNSRAPGRPRWLLRELAERSRTDKSGQFIIDLFRQFLRRPSIEPGTRTVMPVRGASYFLSGVMQGGGGGQSMQVSSARARARFERDIHKDRTLSTSRPVNDCNRDVKTEISISWAGWP